jgi:predicted HTH domain antitoxin
MNTIKFEMEVPEAFSAYVDVKDKDYQKHIRELMLYELIKEDKISFGKAAEILGIEKISLIADMGKLGIPYFEGSIDEVKADAENIKKLLEDAQ